MRRRDVWNEKVSVLQSTASLYSLEGRGDGRVRVSVGEGRGGEGGRRVGIKGREVGWVGTVGLIPFVRKRYYIISLQAGSVNVSGKGAKGTPLPLGHLIFILIRKERSKERERRHNKHKKDEVNMGDWTERSKGRERE